MLPTHAMPLEQPQAEDDRLASLHARIADLESQLEQHQRSVTQQVQRSSDRQQVETDLERAYHQAHIFADITLKVRESLQLDEILNTTVMEIQQFLQADRVIMYQIPAQGAGHVVAEAVVPGYQAILGRDILDTCFTTEYAQRYQNGRIRAINDIDTGEIQQCHADLLRQFNVRANLVVPILISPSSLGTSPSSLVISPSSVDNQGQGTTDKGQPTTDHEQRIKDKGQRTKDERQGTRDKGQLPITVIGATLLHL